MLVIRGVVTCNRVCVCVCVRVCVCACVSVCVLVPLPLLHVYFTMILYYEFL